MAAPRLLAPQGELPCLPRPQTPTVPMPLGHCLVRALPSLGRPLLALCPPSMISPACLHVGAEPEMSGWSCPCVAPALCWTVRSEPTRPRLECLRETGLILRCDRKVGNPFQTKQGSRPSCQDQEGRNGSEEQAEISYPQSTTRAHTYAHSTTHTYTHASS